MSLSNKILILLGGIIIFTTKLSFSQTKTEYEKKISKNKKEIEYINKLVEETKKTKESSLNQLVTLNQKIAIRENTINIIGQGIRDLDKQISQKNSIIKALEKDLKQLKDEYAKMLVYAYKNRNSYNRLLFIFSSESFNQAYKRLKYLQQYSEYREKQAELILQTKALIKEKVRSLQTKKHERLDLLMDKEIEKQFLFNEKQEKSKVVEGLKAKENQLKKDLKKKQEEAVKLQKELEKIIAEEIRRAKEAAAKQNKPASASNIYSLTPEELKLSSSFSSNKGKLPWPVERGIVSSTFGKHRHPDLAYIEINNNGINFQTNEKATARAVFDGYVTAVMIIPGSNKVVIIKHGEYFSVYTNLKEVFVKKGDKVKTKQEIGVIDTDDNTGKTELHLEIWQGKTFQDPDIWLLKR